MSIEVFLDQLETSNNTKSAYKQGLRHFKTYRQGRNLSPELSEGFVRYLEDKELKPSSRKLYLVATIRYLDWLSQQGEFTAGKYIKYRGIIQPLRDEQEALKPDQEKPDLPGPEEMERVLAHLDLDPDHRNLRDQLEWERNRALFKLLLGTGIRPSEACAVIGADRRGNRLRIIIKGGKQGSMVILPPAVIESLDTYRHTRRDLDEQSGEDLWTLPLIARHDKKASKKVLPISVRTAENILAKIRAEAGIKSSLTPYTLRHYAATNIHEKAGGDTFLVRQALNHKSLLTTERYVHYPEGEAALVRLEELGDELLKPLGTGVPNTSI